eukprot:4313935-Pleurochrysis_carterae.AAC.2
MRGGPHCSCIQTVSNTSTVVMPAIKLSKRCSSASDVFVLLLANRDYPISGVTPLPSVTIECSYPFAHPRSAELLTQ